MLVYVTHQRHFCPFWRITLTVVTWMHDSVARLSGSNRELFFRLLVRDLHCRLSATPSWNSSTALHARCPSIDSLSSWSTSNMARFVRWKVLFFLLMRMALAQYQSCLSILLISYIDILLVNDEISSFIYRVTFSFNNGVSSRHVLECFTTIKIFSS